MNMYVSNLSFNTDESQLKELFSAYGEVSSVKIITDRETGRSRGFAFVEMPSDEDSRNAMSGLNNKEVGGRQMSVSEAREKTERKSGGNNRNFNNNRGGGSRW